MTAPLRNDPLAQRLRRDAEDLPGVSLAWSEGLAQRLDGVELPGRRRRFLRPLAAAAALTLALASAWLVSTWRSRASDPSSESSSETVAQAEVPRLSAEAEATASAVRMPQLADSLEAFRSTWGNLLQRAAAPQPLDPLQREYEALRSDAKRVARAALERAKAPLAPLVKTWQRRDS